MSTDLAGADVTVVLPEAELFGVAEAMLVEVLGRIRPDDRGILLPPIPDLPIPQGETALWVAVERYAEDEACVPARLAGRVERFNPAGTLDVDDPQQTVAELAARSIAAARDVRDGDAVVHAPYGPVPARQYLLRLTVTRSLLAHYVAAYLGSTACPLPEELARPLLELTSPSAAAWRALGIFREPLPVPALASWRDRFLLAAGHLPHPLGH